MNTTPIIKTVLAEADIRENGEGMQAAVLVEAMSVAESDFSEPLDGDELLLELLGKTDD